MARASAERQRLQEQIRDEYEEEIRRLNEDRAAQLEDGLEIQRAQDERIVELTVQIESTVRDRKQLLLEREHTEKQLEGELEAARGRITVLEGRLLVADKEAAVAALEMERLRQRLEANGTRDADPTQGTAAPQGGGAEPAMRDSALEVERDARDAALLKLKEEFATKEAQLRVGKEAALVRQKEDLEEQAEKAQAEANVLRAELGGANNALRALQQQVKRKDEDAKFVQTQLDNRKGECSALKEELVKLQEVLPFSFQWSPSIPLALSARSSSCEARTSVHTLARCVRG